MYSTSRPDAPAEFPPLRQSPRGRTPHLAPVLHRAHRRRDCVAAGGRLVEAGSLQALVAPAGLLMAVRSLGRRGLSGLSRHNPLGPL